ncbi:hypothetical protein NE237_025217 [Protea cynaroides]|uniref:F-box domain-containing protein n=1 Tax=Protea cynaroides TaxID=273540 RepID=A0A9Q0H3S3_9MAGN|nr:hypothetical protein NE237_025217 [Protea cynaroides]
MSLSKLKLDPSLNGDIISDMPPNIIENILSRLPIKEAVRTCMLSKKWRHNWVTLPELIFSFTLGNALINRNDRVIKFIDDLSHHLCIPNTGYMEIYMERWILCLSRNDIQELILCQQPQLKHYELPLSLYSCELLNHLELSFCTLKLESAGFTFENLISRWPILEILKIEGLTGPTDLIIYAPKLKNIVVSGFCQVIQNICFKNTPLLACPKRLNQEEGDIARLIKVFGCFVRVVKLAVVLGCGFCTKDAPECLLSYEDFNLDLKICCNDVHMVSMALCLLKYLDLLLQAVTHTYIRLRFPKIRGGPEFSLNQLRNVKIKYFDGWIRQLEFIEFLLGITPVLEMMSINGFKGAVAEGYPMDGTTMLEVLM